MVPLHINHWVTLSRLWGPQLIDHSCSLISYCTYEGESESHSLLWKAAACLTGRKTLQSTHSSVCFSLLPSPNFFPYTRKMDSYPSEVDSTNSESPVADQTGHRYSMEELNITHEGWVCPLPGTRKMGAAAGTLRRGLCRNQAGLFLTTCGGPPIVRSHPGSFGWFFL